MALSIGNTSVSNGAQAATGIFNGPVTFSGTRDDSFDAAPSREILRACRNAIFLTDPNIDRDEIVRAKGDRTKGTCQWIIENEKYRSWLKGDARLLWIRGGPGKGKTMMSIFISQELATDDQRSTIHYFCSGQNASRNTATGVLRGLVWQIIDRHPDLTRHIVPFFDPPGRGKATVSSEETLWQLFMKLLSELRPRRLYCLIDGMDECDDDSTQWLARKFRSIERNPDEHTLSLVILSRDIVELQGSNCVVLDQDHRGQVSADVKLFIQDQARQLSYTLRTTPTFQEHVADVLIVKSEGTFLWVGFVIKELLAKKAPTQVGQALEAMPKGLPAFYARMLRHFETGHKEACRILLTWAVMAFKSLSLPTIADILGVTSTGILSQEQATRDMISECSPMLILTGQTLSLVHQSVRDYLLDSRLDLDPVLQSFRIQPEEAHKDLALRSLEALRRNTYLQYYALLNWPKHANCCLALASTLIADADFFFAEQSTTRDKWWRKFSLNFRGLPEVPPPRLHVACYLGFKAWIDVILSKASCSSRDSIALIEEQCALGWTPLGYAVESDSIGAVEILLQDKSLEMSTSGALQSAMRKVALNGRESYLRLLLQLGMDFNFPDTQGRSLLHHTILSGHTEITRTFLQHGADPNAVDLEGSCLLHVAHTAGRENEMRLLLKAGAEPNAVDPKGVSLLHVAYATGRESAMRLLLEAGADPNSLDTFENTLLHMAAIALDPDDLQLLIDHGAEVDARNRTGKTVLHTVITSTRHSSSVSTYHRRQVKALRIDSLRTLLDRNADPNIRLPSSKDYPGCFPLYVACSRAMFNEVSLLIQRGAELDACNVSGETALWAAVRVGSTIIASFLIDSGADINVTTDDRRSMVHCAADNDHDRLVKMLVERGVSADSQDCAKSTALHVAVQKKFRDVVSALLRLGANPNIFNSAGHSALHYAIKARDFWITNNLLRHGANPNGWDEMSTLAPLSERPLHEALSNWQLYAINKGSPGDVEGWLDSRGIVHQLLEYGADPSLASRAGLATTYYSEIWQELQTMIHHKRSTVVSEP